MSQYECRWTTGKFGHEWRRGGEDLSYFRIVCLELAYGEITQEYPNTYQQRWIQPDGFEVTPQAAAYFNISQEQAASKGKPLREVLAEFLHAVATIGSKGGRICAHHLEFDAVIVDMELQRAGFGEKCGMWANLVEEGFCSMNRHAAHWVCNQKGYPGARPVGTTDLKDRLVPRLSCIDNEAKKLWHIVRALREQVRAYDNVQK